MSTTMSPLHRPYRIRIVTKILHKFLGADALALVLITFLAAGSAMGRGNLQPQNRPPLDQIALQGNRGLEQSLAKETSCEGLAPVGEWPSVAGAGFRTQHLVQTAQNDQPQPAQEEPPEEPPPLPGYKRLYDQTALQCIGGYWHEITYAFYAATAGGMTQIFVKIGDKDTGERCFVLPPEKDGKGRPKQKSIKSLECINGYWYEVTYVVYDVGNPKNPFKNPENPTKIKEIWVRFAETPTGKSCSVTTPKPNPLPEGTIPQPGGGATPGTTPPPPCPGGVLGSSRARSECNPDGFWHVVSDEEWICPDGTKKQIKRDVEKTNQPCKPGQLVPPGLPGSTMTPQPPGQGTPQGAGGQTPGSGSSPSGSDKTSGPSAEALRQQIQSSERESGSGHTYVPLQPPEQQLPTMPVLPSQPRRMPSTPADMAPAPNWPTNPTPGASGAVTPAPTGFPGRWRGDNGCGLGSLTIVNEGGRLVAQGMPGNGSVSLGVDGSMATAQGVVLFGQPNHQLLFSLSGSRMQIQGRNPMGGSCNENFVRQ